MEADRWRRLEALFHAAAALPPPARGPYLRRACPGDPRLVAEILRLLTASDRAGDFLEGLIEPPRDGG